MNDPHDYKPPLLIDDQYALLLAYRRALAQVLILERELVARKAEIGRLRVGVAELSFMIQGQIEELSKTKRPHS
jgi:hypothetical protein